MLYICTMKSKKSAKSFLSKEALEVIKGKSIKVTAQEEKIKYSKMKYATIYKGYDFLENLFTIRTFIQKTYNIDRVLLELLLKLMGMRIFTRKQYSEISKEFSRRRLSALVEFGLVNRIMDNRDTEKRLYCLNTKGRTIVINFYQYLSGEKHIPEDGRYNVFANTAKQVAFDKKKLAIIKQMNKSPIKEYNKVLFKE